MSEPVIAEMELCGLTVRVQVEGDANILTATDGQLGVFAIVRSFLSQLEEFGDSDGEPQVARVAAPAATSDLAPSPPTFACDQCPRGFATTNALRAHKRWHLRWHETNDAEKLEAVASEKRVAVPTQVERHVNGAPRQPKPLDGAAALVCEDCGERFEVTNLGAIDLGSHTRSEHGRQMQRSERTPKSPVAK